MTDVRKEPLPQKVDLIAAAIVRHARNFLETTGVARPVAFICNIADEKIMPMPLDFDSDSHKAASARTIRLAARALKADCIIFLSEGWGIEMTRSDNRFDRISKSGIVEDEPDRIEVVIFNIDTYEGTWTAMPKIVREEGKQPTFGEPEWLRMSGEGRFVGMLPIRGSTH